jgi:hypothetical protein
VKGIKKVPKYSGLDVGVDPVELRENPRSSANILYLLGGRHTKKSRISSGLKVGVDPVGLRESPRPAANVPFLPDGRHKKTSNFFEV